jgi:hypothetical protein
LTVLAAGYIAFRFGGLGGADGKIATVVAAVSPLLPSSWRRRFSPCCCPGSHQLSDF